MVATDVVDIMSRYPREYLSNVFASICPIPTQYLSNIAHLGLLSQLSDVSCEKNGCHCLVDNKFQERVG